MKAHNPILQGFYPDPSICRKGDEFFLVCSSFAYFPGVPIFKSRNLAEWEQIGNVLDRKGQLPLQHCGHSAGIYAPTIRFHEGTFYMITTNVGGGGNFVVTAKNPEGPWSKPYYLGQEARGIDPSLLFDGGKCYYVGACGNTAGVKYYGDGEIWAQELDLDAMRLCGERHILWHGAMKEAAWQEGPHIYKKDGYYYLMIAEGGTGPGHAITVARSRDVFGPYEGSPYNPILTHRHLGKGYPVQYAGHGDMVEDREGNWFMVMLASRPCKGFTNLGRETFLAKVIWEDGWPVVNPGVGKLEEWVQTGMPPNQEGKFQSRTRREYIFDMEELPFDMVTVRNPVEDMYSLREYPGFLRLHAAPRAINDETNASYLGIRQQHYAYRVETKMNAEGGKVEAGLVILQSDKYHLRYVVLNEDQKELAVIRCEDGIETVLARTDISPGDTLLSIEAKDQEAAFYYEQDGKAGQLTGNVDTTFLSTERAGGFVGCTIGVYAASGGGASHGYADFEWLIYEADEEEA